MLTRTILAIALSFFLMIGCVSYPVYADLAKSGEGGSPEFRQAVIPYDPQTESEGPFQSLTPEEQKKIENDSKNLLKALSEPENRPVESSAAEADRLVKYLDNEMSAQSKSSKSGSASSSLSSSSVTNASESASATFGEVRLSEVVSKDMLKGSPENLSQKQKPSEKTSDFDQMTPPAKPVTSGGQGAPRPERDLIGFLTDNSDFPLSKVNREDESEGLSGAVLTGPEGDRPAVDARADDTQAVTVLESVRFSDQIHAIHQLMNPPEDLHPWLKWLLYSSQVNREMLSLYYSTLKKRDQIYQRALQSQGKLAILYKNKIFKDMPIFVMPEWGSGDYSLVKLGGDHRDVSAGLMAQVNLSSS